MMSYAIVKTAYALWAIVRDDRPGMRLEHKGETVSCSDQTQCTHVYVLRYWLSMAVNPAVVEIGFRRECCGLRSADHR